MTRRSAGGLAALALAACQARAPRLPEPLPPAPPELVARFRSSGLVDAPVPAAALVGLPLLGTPGAGGDAGGAIDEIGEIGEIGDAGASGASAPLGLEDVLASVERHFPLVLAALTEVAAAEGRLLQARGGFDTRLTSKVKIDAEGFYESERFDLGLEQPTPLWGATFGGGYRLGTGDFADYDGGDQTNDSGEVRLGVTLPLLQNRRIDSRRVAEWQALIDRGRAEPLVAEKRLEAVRKASDAYWRWVSAGGRREVARRLLALAEDRQSQIELGVEEGLFAPIAESDNRRTIVERRAGLIQAERRLQQVAIELSLYLRDEAGLPRVPGDAELRAFPEPRDPSSTLVAGDLELALQRRPELRALELELSGIDLELELAENALQPKLDLGLFVSQDLGPAASSPDDKGPFEVEAGLSFDLPLQRRRPRGKQAELAAKQTKLRRELQFARDLVVADVRDAVSALTQSWLRIAQARENVELAAQLAEAERVQLQAGESDLLRVNLREQQSAVAEAGLVDVLDEHFRALARYYAVLGVPYGDLAADPGARATESDAPGGVRS